MIKFINVDFFNLLKFLNQNKRLIKSDRLTLPWIIKPKLSSRFGSDWSLQPYNNQSLPNLELNSSSKANSGGSESS